MAKLPAGSRIPSNLQDRYDVIAAQIEEFSNEYLNDDYKELCLQALTKLCRKRPSPITSGKPQTWAAAIIHSIGSANFLFDSSQKIHMQAQDIAEAFGLSKSTVGNKAAQIRKMLKIDYYNPEWALPSMLESSPFFWMVSINGMVADARNLPVEFQIACYQQGLIPYVPALKEKGKDDTQAEE